MHAAICALALMACACDARPSLPSTSTNVNREVVLYCSTDAQFARPLIAEFQRHTGVTVHAVFDTEAGKTTGLIERLRAERHRPRADVWWSSEIFGTIELARAGVLTKYSPAAATDIPTPFRDVEGRWTAIALRGRVVAFDPARVKAEDAPQRWADFADPKYRGRVVLANPQFGTTRGHMASLLAAWGEATFTAWLDALAANQVRLADGNAHCVQMVLRGQAEFCWTDTDDVFVAKRRGDSIAWVYPDFDSPDAKGEKRPGTLWIPNSVALVADGPNAESGKQLIEYLVSADVETQLSKSDSANIPVRPVLAERATGPRGPVAAVVYSDAAALLRRSDDLCREKLSH